MTWKSLDTEALLERLRRIRESTTSANVGGFAVPIGGVLRREAPLNDYDPLLKNVLRKYKKRKRSK